VVDPNENEHLMCCEILKIQVKVSQNNSEKFSKYLYNKLISLSFQSLLCKNYFCKINTVYIIIVYYGRQTLYLIEIKQVDSWNRTVK
jgi:hypothetical protein